jgi:hypothetical protein
MPKQEVQGGEADQVLDVVFPASDETAEAVHPSEEPLHFHGPRGLKPRPVWSRIRHGYGIFRVTVPFLILLDGRCSLMVAPTEHRGFGVDQL